MPRGSYAFSAVTSPDHALIGRLLGFPECCVEEWVADRARLVMSAVDRGAIHGRVRSLHEVEQLLLSGVPEHIFSGPFDVASREKCYVPCTAHVGAPGWRPWGNA
jgi:hypothetical protein